MTQTQQRSDGHRSAVLAEVEWLKQEPSRARHLPRRADCDHDRQRTQRAGDRAALAVKCQLVLVLLDVLDDFERALTCANTA